MNKPSHLLHQVSAINSTAPNKNGADRASVRTPSAPPVYRPQPAPQAAQAKMRPSVQMTSAQPTRAAGGVIQANIIGGTHALQARLALLRAPVYQPKTQAPSTAQRKAAGNLGHTPVQPVRPQTIQRKSANGVEAFQVPLQPKSGGQLIPDKVRAKMETAFGMDFSDVRVHVGQEASSIGAIAYTWGTNIHFAPGQYNPHTIQGQKLLGHELWHVVQQKSGRVSNPFGGGVAVVQDHALEAEADRMGIKAAMTALVEKPGGGK
jgi:hypothetical protein